MKNVASILLLVERGDQGHQALNKALLLARHLRARLELFLCDTERYSFPRSSGDEPAQAALDARVAHAREYLHALRKTILVPEIEVSSDVACHVSLRAALVDKLRRSRVDLVVKAAYTSQLGQNQHDSIDWPLVASCAAPILLTRGRPWHPVPRFAAAVDLRDRQGGALRSAITAIGDKLSRSCGARLETLFADARAESTLEAERLSAPLEAIAQALPLDARRVHRLVGEPSEVLPRFVAHCDYDLVVMGKPRHGAPSEATRSVAARVVKATAGDVLFAHVLGEPTRRQVRGRAVAGASAGLGARRRREL
jgi:hypothetical protein